MKKFITTLLFLIGSSLLFSQYSQIKFRESSFENGMLYPIAVSPSLPEIADSINADLQKNIADLKSSDFCVGQYGYVQKADILQIHIFCNCIDFKESQNRYYLYNVDTGKPIENMHIIDERKVKKFTPFFVKKVENYTQNFNIQLTDNQKKSIENDGLNVFKMVLSKDGINLWFKEQWGEKPLFLSWVELKEFMRYS